MSLTRASALRFATWLVTLAVGAFQDQQARAADSEPTPTVSSCPEGEAVWSTVVKLVPSASAQLLEAKPHVEIVDLGERYRVHVLTEGGVLERVYSDPARDCDKRARFAAEFIVVSLLPPQLLLGAEAAPKDAAPESSDRAPTASASAPSSSPVTLQRRTEEKPAIAGAHGRKPVVRIELSGLAEASPPVLGAPGVLEWGGNLRVRVGEGRLGGTVGVGYLPRVDFDAGNFRGAVTRVPATVGVAVRLLEGPFRIDGDIAATAAFERYEGVSPHMPSDGTRLAPGLEVGLTASPHSLAGLAPLVSLSCAWMPLTEELVAAPQGNVATTPSLWFGAALGMSIEL